jgi:nucleotide-binding universal stress UspA family protein
MDVMADGTETRASAAYDFQRARRRAALTSVVARLLGTSHRLLPYEEVRRRLRAVEGSGATLQDVPLEAIVGSVGRYQDFTREFLPLVDEDKGRWVGVRLAMTGLEGVPPVELYRIGDAYFVKDGNHRVSVARQLGAKTIQAWVTPVYSRVPLGPDADAEAIALAGSYAAFLEETGIDQLRPGADLRLTEPLRYPSLLEHISVHRYFMGIDEDRPVSWDEAVAHWYDAVYLPVAEAIEEHDLLARFPGRTVTDLYLFLSDHRARLEQEFGWTLEGPELAEGLRVRFDLPSATERLKAAVAEGKDVKEALPGLVDTVLVVMEKGRGDAALGPALEVAAREGAKLLALLLGADPASDEAAAAREQFERRCRAAGVPGQLAASPREPLGAIVSRAAYADLVVVSSPAGRPTGWVRSLLHRSPRPLLLTRGEKAFPSRPLLAYDGRERAELALFALAYMVLAHGGRPVVVCVSERGRPAGPVLEKAAAFLGELGVAADLVTERGAVDAAIARAAEREGADLLVMGSYKYSRWLEEVTGGVTDRVVARVRAPVLVT